MMQVPAGEQREQQGMYAREEQTVAAFQAASGAESTVAIRPYTRWSITPTGADGLTVLLTLTWPLEQRTDAQSFMTALDTDLAGTMAATPFAQCATLQWTAIYFSNTNIYVATEVFSVDSVKASLWFPGLDAITTDRSKLEADVRTQVATAAGVPPENVDVNATALQAFARPYSSDAPGLSTANVSTGVTVEIIVEFPFWILDSDTTDSATERSRFARLLYSDTQALLAGSTMAAEEVVAAWTMQFAGSKSGMKVMVQFDDVRDGFLAQLDPPVLTDDASLRLQRRLSIITGLSLSSFQITNVTLSSISKPARVVLDITFLAIESSTPFASLFVTTNYRESIMARLGAPPVFSATLRKGLGSLCCLTNLSAHVCVLAAGGLASRMVWAAKGLSCFARALMRAQGRCWHRQSIPCSRPRTRSCTGSIARFSPRCRAATCAT